MDSNNSLYQNTEVFFAAVKSLTKKINNGEINIEKPEFGRMRSFPNGCCKDASYMLYEYLNYCGLADKQNSQIIEVDYGKEAKLVSRYNLNKKPNDRITRLNHVWLICQGYHIDITFGQFGGKLEFICCEHHPFLNEKYPECWSENWEVGIPKYSRIEDVDKWFMLFDEIYSKIEECISENNI